MHEMTHKYLMTKISISRESDWLVLVVVMLIYCLPTWSLDHKQKYNLEWPIDQLLYNEEK